MSNLGKCQRCGKTAYALEGVKVGPPGKGEAQGCTWKLDLRSYKFCDGKVWCANHEPMKGFSNKEHVHGKVETNAVSIDTAIHAPKLDKVNEQIRGANAGQAPQLSLDAMGISNAIHTPKLDVVNEQIRGTGEKPNVNPYAN